MLRDKIPLNEHFLALKNKFNNERDGLKKRYEAENKRHEQLKNDNKKLKESIQSSSREVNIMSNTLTQDKDKNCKELRDLETKQYSEQHTRTILLQERDRLNKELMGLR